MTSATGNPFLRSGEPFETAPGTAINRLYLANEAVAVAEALELARLPAAERQAIHRDAMELVAAARRRRAGKGGVEAFLQQYHLASQEGVVLMCLAEALLRIPDAETADRLIADKISTGQWSDHIGEAESLFVNASTWGLMLTGQLVRPTDSDLRDPGSVLRRLVARLGEPVVRAAFRQAMRIMGHQFVMGRTIGEALERAATGEDARYRHTYDMLGESALTAPDALRYRQAYSDAIKAVGASVQPGSTPASWPSISVKLSALHPRYEFGRRDQVLSELGDRIESLALEARDAGIALTIDAAGELGRPRPRRPGLCEARGRCAAPCGPPRGCYRTRAEYPPGQGRVLGQRGQACAGARPARLPGLHTQAEHGCQLPGLCPHPAGRQPAPVSAVRDPQRAHGREHHPARIGTRP
jgi:RHH-type proline utilization regulon transcriptional repressor/proline dehydrogenase/delta 1-pyrroline-5-carboxylate dehydrogenase